MLLRTRRFMLCWSKTVDQWVSPVAVPTENVIIVCRPGDMLMTARTMLGRFWRKINLMFPHMHYLDVFWRFFSLNYGES
jgi:hypothetical protein